jgi:outer membrane protein assembly factor BamB
VHRRDVSPELAFDKDGDPLPPRRLQAVDPEAGETAKPNPNSAVIWHYSQHDANGDGKFDFEETFHRTMGNATIEDGLLYVADISGLFHCLDAATGKPHWTYDQFSTCWGTPLVADGKVYIADSDGEMTVFKLSAEQEILAEEINMGDLIHTSAVIANNVLYIATRSRLFAIAAE